jgi:hypothetical protein
MSRSGNDPSPSIRPNTVLFKALLLLSNVPQIAIIASIIAKGERVSDMGNHAPLALFCSYAGDHSRTEAKRLLGGNGYSVRGDCGR